MRHLWFSLAGLFLLSTRALAGDVLITHALIYDGTGQAPFHGDLRIRDKKIIKLAKRIKPLATDLVTDAKGLSVAPGFIDMHTHSDRGLLQDLDAATVSRQGVTTIVIGQDGESNYPLADYYQKLEHTPAAVNVASLIGHATLREQVMGHDLYRVSTPGELARMKEILAHELDAGAFGLSSGLEYEQGHFATTEEVVELAKVAAKRQGFYISHVRDEGNAVFDSFDEVLKIGRDAKIPVEITHIKLGSTPVWHLAAKRIPAYFAQAKREHIDLSADVYPYTYWHSTIRVMVPDRDYFNPQKVSAALADNGGPQAIRLAHYEPEPAMAGKTLAQIADLWQISPVDAYMRIVKATSAEIDSDQSMEDIIVTSMSEDDVRWFVAHPKIMFCSDGELHGSHPRGAGSFPRVLSHYVRDERALSLTQAIHKMTQLPAHQLHLKDRGQIRTGFVADLVLFDPSSVRDQATIDHPEAAPLGIASVMVGGQWVIHDNQVTGQRPGQVLRSNAYRPSSRP